MLEMNPQRCSSVRGLGTVRRLHSLVLVVRVPLGRMTEFGWGHAGMGKPNVSGMQSPAWLSLAPKDAGHDLLSNGFFRNVAEDMFTEEVVSSEGTAEVMKNTVLSSTKLKSDSDSLFSVSWQDVSWPGRGKETDPRMTDGLAPR